MKKIKNKIKSRNPFYKELAALSHKVLKNKKKYSRKGKNRKNMSGLHTSIHTPPVAHVRPYTAPFFIFIRQFLYS